VRNRLHTVGVVLIALAGTVAVTNGLWFVVGDHPFDDGGYSEEVDLTHSEAAEVTPDLPDWLLHVSDQVGSVTTGWGLFVVSLAWLEHRRRDRALQTVLLLGGLPTLLFSAFGEHAQFGTVDTGTMLSVLVLGLFLVGVSLIVATTPE
jgi:hypothetical protein